MHKLIAALLFGIGLSAVAMATPVPEIDPTSGVNALALIAGTLMIIRGSRQK